MSALTRADRGQPRNDAGLVAEEDRRSASPAPMKAPALPPVSAKSTASCPFGCATVPAPSNCSAKIAWVSFGDSTVPATTADRP